MIADRWIEKIFGQQGSAGLGSSGGELLGGILGAFFGPNITGFASGGWAPANGLFEINERGFEIATVGNKDYMLTGPSPV